MAKIVDPDDLNQGVEITITPGLSGTIKLNPGSGNLSMDGVTLQCIYSFLKEEWETDSNLINYPFPIKSITDEQFEQQRKQYVMVGGHIKMPIIILVKNTCASQH